MDLRLPLIVVQHGRRRIEAWVPRISGVHKVGPSLAEMRDDLALAVMERFVKESTERLAHYQLAPHSSLRHLTIETTVQDRARRTQWKLEGRLAVLLEKWPRDDFYVVTPTRAPHLRFALRHPDELEDAFELRLREYALEHQLETLAPWHAENCEHLEVLEVDADPPSIFPYELRRRRKKAEEKKENTEEKRPDEEDEEEEEQRKKPETAEELEATRRRSRLAVRTLREIGRNLSHAAADDALEPCFGRDGLARLLLDLVAGREGVGIVLVGPSGVGKTALVHELTRRLRKWCLEHGTRRDVWRVDGNRFIAGMSYVGQWEQRAQSLTRELCDTGDVLFADDLASLVFAGRHAKGNTHVAQFLEPFLARGELTIVGECTPQRFELVRELAPSFASLFRVVPVPAMDDFETLPVLLGALRELESEWETVPTRFAPAALETLLHLSRRYLSHEYFPGKSVRLLRSTLALDPERVEGRSGRVERRYHVEHVYRAVAAQTGLPDFLLRTDAPRPREQISQHFSSLIAGQPEAVEAMTEVVLAMQHALGDPGKPLGTFLFVGPTGVGKTETAKALARYLFGDAGRMVRFDMSEFASGASVTRLVGHSDAPDGELTTALRTQPFSVILLDEIEKAHPRVFDALLQLLGEGRLTDAAGRTADARQTVILMTSNLGVREAASRSGFLKGDADEARKHYVSAAQKFFRPEFFNRIDRVVPFRSLDGDALRVVVQHALAELLSRKGIRHGNVLVDVEPELLESLVEQSFDPRYGARPLKRMLERRLAVPLAHHLVRRRSGDLAVVSLFRAGEELGLEVAALGAVEGWTPEDETASWTVGDVEEAFLEVRGTLAALQDLEVVRALEGEQSAALRRMARGERGAVPAGLELLERLNGVRERIEAVEQGELGFEGYEEEEVQEDGHDLREHRHNQFHNRYRGGLRPKPGFRAVPVQRRADLILRQVRPEVAMLRDDLEVLQWQLECVQSPGEETWVVLLELATANPSVAAALDVVVQALPGTLASMQPVRLGTEEEQPDPAAPGKRPALLFAVRGFGLAPLLEGLAGYALLEPADWTGTPALVRIECARSPEPRAWLSERDARVERARAARRSGESVELFHVPQRLTIRGGLAEGQRKIHLRTGLAASATVAVLATLLRKAERGSPARPGAGGD